MKKKLEINQFQRTALSNGAKLLLMPINTKGMKMSEIGLIEDLLQFSPIQEGDEFFCQEEFIEDYAIGGGDENSRIDIIYRASTDESHVIGYAWADASEMTEAQSRFNLKCVGVEVKRLDELTAGTIINITPSTIKSSENYRDWLNQQYGEDFYESNPCVFLIQVGER